MSRRFLIFAGCIGVAAVLAFAYFEIPPGRIDAVDWAHAAINATTGQSGDSDDFGDRIEERRLEIASHQRQEEGAKAFGHAPSGKMARIVALPFGTPDSARVAKDICHFLLNSGFVQDIEAKFPSIAKTNSHQLTLAATTDQGTGGVRSAVAFSFEYTGFVRQGDPRKIADYAEALVRKEVNSRCWADAGFDPHPPRIPDTSETAVITDLPGEPDTAAAQDKVFAGETPRILKNLPVERPPSPNGSTPPSPTVSGMQPPASNSQPSVAAAGPAPAPRAAGEAYAGERQNRINELQRRIESIDKDIAEVTANPAHGSGSHQDATGRWHPNYVGVSASDRIQALVNLRANILSKIEKLKAGVPVSSVDSAPSTGINSLDDVPRL